MTVIEHRSGARADSPRKVVATAAVAGIEMWERFSFYGMQAICLYYLYWETTRGGLGIDRTTATALMGAYGAFVYLMTLAGGWTADRISGPEKTLLGGALVLVAGHAVLSLVAGVAGITAGLLCVGLGSGFLKASAVTVLGAAHRGDAGQRDAAFQVFYLGINIGALAGPLLVGFLQVTYGFRAGFAAAAILMVMGVANYLLLRSRYLAELGGELSREITRPRAPLSPRGRMVAAACVPAGAAAVAAAVATGVVTPANSATVLLVVTLVAAVTALVLVTRDPDLDAADKANTTAFIPVLIASTAFWSVLNQTYGVLAVYSDVRLDRDFFGLTVPASWTQSLNPFYILLLSVPMAMVWGRLGDRVPSAAKMAVGVMISGGGLLVLLPFTGGQGQSVPFAALALAVLVITIGELLVGPVGMSTATALAPEKYATRFSALYFLTMAAGTAAAGVISRFYDPTDAAAERGYFLACGLTVIAIGLGCLWAVKALGGRT
ncbi:peptide MFS transporter [Corynebacterium mendelii]|uniref:MFS transporter n=1 Tax=Corynebacterium mendelii TaxID=2765362 RepID=A0A939E0N9_9CORY|nr:oligopeptide:H+ symporter [Corynebacterium mendelii]MBN9643576.1 MFS transporter [Corynebacterium mendelii]